MKKTYLFIVVAIIVSCNSSRSQNDIGKANADIFEGIKTQNIDLLKPYFFNNDNISLFQNSLNLTDEELKKLRNSGKLKFASYELIEQVRNEDDNGKIKWENAEFTVHPKYDNLDKLKPRKTKQAEMYQSLITFKDADKTWALDIMYLKTKNGLFVLRLDDKHFELKN